MGIVERVSNGGDDGRGDLVLSDQAVHLLRTVTQTNLTLSQMADQKAGILMAAAFVVFTLAVNQAAHGPLAHAMLCLAFFAFLAAVLAVFAILPATGQEPGPAEGRNMLFFGMFGHFSEEDFIAHLMETVESDDGIMRAMARDIHQNGLVLKRKKYRFLRYSYLTFLAGLLLTFALFLLEQFPAPARIGL